MTSTSHPAGGSGFAAFDRILVDLGFALLTWGFRRAELRPPAHARTPATTHPARRRSARRPTG